MQFISFGEADNWGKRRSGSPEVGRWFSSQLESVVAAIERIPVAEFLSQGQQTLSIGLDIHGPGGGQWKLTATHGSCEITEGLPTTDHHLLKMNDLDVAKLVNGNGACSAAAWASKLQDVLGASVK